MSILTGMISMNQANLDAYPTPVELKVWSQQYGDEDFKRQRDLSPSGADPFRTTQRRMLSRYFVHNLVNRFLLILSRKPILVFWLNQNSRAQI